VAAQLTGCVCCGLQNGVFMKWWPFGVLAVINRNARYALLLVGAPFNLL
jgi:membrane protein YqaA with SNARE-associated domain